MPMYVVRVWLPDRPGALGAVASRIGAVRGDLVGIDILERGAGLVIDELLVELDHPGLVPLLVSEMAEVDGVAVEELRPVQGDCLPDARLSALETAALLAEQTREAGVLEVLVRRAVGDFGAGWAAVVDPAAGSLVAAVGEVPPAAWISAYASGNRAAEVPAVVRSRPDDVAWAVLERADVDLVVGRPGRPFRDRERLQLSALVRIADARWAELARLAAVLAHPAALRSGA